MKSIKLAYVAMVAVVLLAWGIGEIPAEVSAQHHEDGTYVLVLGVIEGPDPIPQIIWEPIREGGEFIVLNPEGADRGDGRPDFDFYGSDPVAVWSYHTGSDHDIAFTRWNGESWDPIEFLTSDLSDDLDPRVYVDSVGTIHVVWWIPGTPGSIHHVSGTPGNWGTEVAVAAVGQRPSIGDFGGSLAVAYERPTNEAQEIVVTVLDGHEPDQGVAMVQRPDRLDPVLNFEAGHTWVAWKHSDQQLGYSEWIGGAWTAPSMVAWPESSWIGEQNAREQVRQAILGQ